MKKLILIPVACAIVSVAFAQTDTTSQRKMNQSGIQNDTITNSGRNEMDDRIQPHQHMQTDSGMIRQHEDRSIKRNADPNYGRQDDGSINKPARANDMQDGVMKKNGKMIVIRNGQPKHLTESITLLDGSRVLPEGTIVRKNGQRVIIKEDEYIDMSGNTIKRNPSDVKRAQPDPDNRSKEKSKDKNMYLVPDSTLKKD